MLYQKRTRYFDTQQRTQARKRTWTQYLGGSGAEAALTDRERE